MTGELKIAKRTMIQSFDSAFQATGGFLEKGRVYLTAVRVFRDDCSYVRSLEKPMAHAVDEKSSWNTAEEVTTLADVCQVFAENRCALSITRIVLICQATRGGPRVNQFANDRLLNGELKQYVDAGIDLLKICGCLCYDRLKITVLPSLIEAMVTVHRFPRGS